MDGVTEYFFLGAAIFFGFVIFLIWRGTKLQQEEDERERKLKKYWDEYEKSIKNLDIWWERIWNSYSLKDRMTSVDHLDKELSVFGSIVKKIESVLVNKKDFSNELQEQIKPFGYITSLNQQIDLISGCYMMDENNYGKINEEYYQSIKRMARKDVDTIIDTLYGRLQRKDKTLFAADLKEILKCIWYYALEKPYRADSFNKANEIFRKLYIEPYPFNKKGNIDYFVADIYAKIQIGGEDVARGIVKDNIANVQIASALMWMKAYKLEYVVLQNVLNKGENIPPKVQERLHMLAQGVDKTPSSYAVVSNQDMLHCDMAAIAWGDEEYNRYFENLSFQEKVLTYALAIREENKSIMVSSNEVLPSYEEFNEKLKNVITEEFGDTAKTYPQKCHFMFGNDEEIIDATIMESSSCKYMGILLYVAQIGKKVNVRFFTLLLPVNKELEEQKKQAISIQKKINPSIDMWEDGLKNIALIAIQQMMNESSSNVGMGKASSNFTQGEISF